MCQCIDNVYVCDAQTCQRKEKSIVTVVKPITSQIIEESVIVKKEPTQVVISTITPPADCAPEKYGRTKNTKFFQVVNHFLYFFLV